MKRKIGIKELHSMARQMKYYDFENWVAKELFDQPETVDTSKLTDKLFLYDVMSSLTIEDITKIVNAFTDINIPIEAVIEEIELNYL